MLPRVLRFHIGANGKIVILLFDFIIRSKMSEMLYLFTTRKSINNFLCVFFGQPIILRNLDALLGGINKKSFVIRFSSLQNHDAGCDRCPIE